MAEVEEKKDSGYHSVEETIKIYTDWANHYLERSKHKRLITDLQVDICDGVLLAEVIQAVTNEKVRDIKTKPRNSAQMVENINTCLTCLGNLGVSTEGLSAKDIKDGNLKSILGLFFSLSRYKQQQKQKQQNLNQSRSGGSSSTASTPSSATSGILNNNQGEMLSRLPAAKGSSKCPVVTNPSIPNSKDTNLNNLNSGIQAPSSRHKGAASSDKSLARTQQPSGSSSGTSKSAGQPSVSPSGTLSTGIPKPGSRSAGRSIPSAGERPASRLAAPGTVSSSAGPSSSRQGNRPASASAANKNNSMLDKFKLFNGKEKPERGSGSASTSSLVRPSTASRVSSKSSAHSDSNYADSDRSSSGSTSHLTPQDSGISAGSNTASPKVGMKAFAKKTIGRLSKKSDIKDETLTGIGKRRSPPPQPSSRPTSSVSTASSTSSLASNSGFGTNKKTSKDKSDSSTLGSKGGSKIASLSSSKGSSTKLTKGNLSSSGSTTSIPSHSTGIPKPGSKTAKANTKDESRSKLTTSTGRDSKQTVSTFTGGVRQSSSGSSSSLTRTIPKSSLGSGSSTAPPTTTSSNKHSPDSNMPSGVPSRATKPGAGQESKRLPSPKDATPKDTKGALTCTKQVSQIGMSGKGIPSVGKRPASAKPATSAKPKKVDSDTQTAMSAVKLIQNSQGQLPSKTSTVRENSNHSMESSNSSNGKGSTSNSSNDSVIFRPSSCDELGSGTESESNAPKLRVPTDHISSLKTRQANSMQGATPSYLKTPPRGASPKPPPRNVSPKPPPPSSPKPGAKPQTKVETTFDTEVRTERHDISRSSPKETTFVVEDAEEPIDIKPMQPISRLAPYSYLRNLATPQSKPQINMPTFSVHTNVANSASSRLGVNRSLFDSSKLYTSSLKRTSSNSGVLDNTDCASESDAYDLSTGYMSDGDILRNSKAEDYSGYMSEGGASLYARRMQQRFREGMQAVKECMQKSNALIDDDSFDDSSSISSGEISDTINEISTDENLTGSSLSASSSDHVNPYGSLKRGSTRKDMQQGGAKNPYANTAVLVKGKGGNVIGGRGYAMNGSGGYHRPYVNSDAKSDIGGYTTELDRWHKQRGDPKAGYAIYQGSMTPTGSLPRRLNSESETGKMTAMTRSADASFDGAIMIKGKKKDSEMNTELSSLMLQKQQSGRGHGTPQGYGFRRPVSGVSVASTGSNQSIGSTRSSLSSKIGKAMSESGKNVDANGFARNSSRSNGNSQAGRPLSGIPSSGSSPWSKGSSGSALVANGMRSCMSETESMESLVSATASIQAQIQQARALSLASRNLLQHERGGQRVERSNSIHSSQSEKYSPTNSAPGGILNRTNSFGQLDPNHPTSPTPSQSSGYTYPLSGLSPTTMAAAVSAANSIPYGGSFMPLSKLTSKEDDMHGSSLSLVSSTSSVHSSAEERQMYEIRKLKRELENAKYKVDNLTSQLSTNAHVVSAFEQSLANMTSRLQQLTNTAEQKDSELNDLRATIEALRHTNSFSAAMLNDVNVSRRLSSTSSTLSKESTPASEPMPRITRHRSSESVTSLGSVSSQCSQQSAVTDIEAAKKKKKKNWFRSSFGKAFSRKKGSRGSMSDVEGDSVSLRSESSLPNSPLLQVPHQMSLPSPLMSSNSTSRLLDGECKEEAVLELQQQLHEKDMKLTDIRLDALSSAHQLEHLKETMNRMKSEMSALKADNDRLQRLVGPDTVKSPAKLLGKSTESLEKRLSFGDPTSPIDLLLSAENQEREGRRITVSVCVGPGSDLAKLPEGKLASVLIGALTVSGKTKWDMLDGIIKRIFKEYVLRVAPVTNLGLNADSVFAYHIGEIIRMKDSKLPELLPCGYLVGDNTDITVHLKSTKHNSVDSLAFETLIPKSIVQRYISLLLEHRRIILCGPSGTGKTYLAQKLAEYLVLKSGKDLTAGAIATFNVDHKSSKELRQYLANIAEQCESSTAGELPNVIILDNLHHVNSLGEVFNGFLTVKYQKCPYIIGTMNQTTCSTTNLQLHHNFRWVLCANHMEPVKGFLGRFLRRKLVESEVPSGSRTNDLNKIVEWMPKVWQHLNKFLETHSSSDVTIGPRLFLSCPMETAGAQVWFTDLWNYSIVPYLLEAVREGLQLYGRRAQWEDPVDWILETYPWSRSEDQDRSLLRLRPEDVGYDSQGAPSGTPAGKGNQAAGGQQSDVDGDPLLNMLMRLQEAASYSSPQSNDSDSTSLDSHSSSLSGTHDYSNNTSSAGPTTNSSVESTL